MSLDRVVWREATASSEAILAHLTDNDEVREALLARGIDIGAYAAKLAQHATTCEAWRDGLLIGLVAAYLNDATSRVGYVSNVSVLAAARGQGVAAALLRRCIDLALARNFETLLLEVSRRNAGAVALYRKCGFREFASDTDVVAMRLQF